ncbi:TRAP transporter large permease [Nesterenkonia sandarakina]|uniref:C4-dicarboxylate transporter DctM subunit n=1 Tax=Nesterenkonia sandarakina TaxID=272918 RepID=A0A7Z0EAL0_9MICC|nr:TRAP transporter large permease [Nesterenkonia sandarakina]NYJ18101.1 C4-dicarboxylate transporter DctM subunit [Nesterenkonia sandarakina]
MDVLTLCLVLLGAIAIGLPIAYALLLSSIVFIFAFDHGLSMGLLAHTLTTANDSFPILAVPFFILAGLIMGRGGISQRLFAVATAWVGHIKGGIGVAAVLTAMFFSAISGSGPATVAAVGGIMIPEMVKYGYSKTFAAALIAAAGTMGVVLPPSIPLVIFGVITGTSIGDLFLAAIIPGLIMGALLIIWVVTHARRHGIEGTPKHSLRERFGSLNQAKGALALPVIILGGIYGGIFTPTEAAVVAVVFGTALSTLLYRELTLRTLFHTIVNAATTSSALMVIVASAAVFALLLTIADAPTYAIDALTSVSTNPVIIMLIITLFMLLLGAFMETIAAVTITAPILVPVMAEIGMDPIQIGVVLIMLLALGFISPPLGANLFVAAKTAGTTSEKTFVAVLPGFALLTGACLLVAFIPALTMTFIS